MMKNIIVIGFLLVLFACGSSGGGGSTTASTDCSADITTGTAMGITAIPDTAASSYKNNFCKYTQLTAPNGGQIAFYAQNKITNEQLIRARSILVLLPVVLPNWASGLVLRLTGCARTGA